MNSIDWGDYNLAHVYQAQQTITGTGTVSFYIADLEFPNNEGELFVDIFGPGTSGDCFDGT